ncbi:MAG: carbohydrate-binding domain-containing protein [Eubacterium sp.]|nr:carbohydrate-binding domain-containing protein [Eubacterium sp.]
MIRYKKFISSIIVIAIMLSFFGCSKAQESSKTTNQTTTQSDVRDDSDMFTNRDYDSSYDESSAVKISLSDKGTTCDSENVEINGSTVTIKNEGTYIISGKLTDGQIIVDIDKSDKAQLVLDNVNINCDTSAAIYVKQADKVFITLADKSKNTLSNKKDFVAIDDNNIDSVIFSKKNLTLNGGGELDITASYGHGIVSKKDLKFTSGTYNIDANEHALQAKNSIRIANGTFNLTANEDGLHSENDDEDNDKGYIYIIGGLLNISVEDDAIHAGKNLTIKGGTIDIAKCYEGLEGETINISGGDISLKASDDGINASSSSSSTDMRNEFAANENCNITISGGIIRVDADGDGIDSNGNLTVTGGEIYIDGPTNDGNGALDYDGTATISGGIVVAVGAVGMAQNFSDGTQCAMLVNASGQANDEIVLKDSSGKEILTYKPGKNYSCALISCPEITQGKTYTVMSGNQDIKVTMTETIYGSNGGMGMGGSRPPMDNRQPMGGRAPMGEGHDPFSKP